MPTSKSARRIALHFFQILLAVMLFATCLGKALDVEGFLSILGTYHLFPSLLIPLIGIGIITAEGGIAVWLLSGRHLAISSLLAAALHVGFTALSIITLVRGIIVPNCGCFGVFLARPLTWGTVFEDGFVTLWCLALFALSDRKLRAV
jgi:hypothetical protein